MALQSRFERHVFRGKVVVQQALGCPGCFGEVLHGGAVKATRGDGLEGSVNELHAALSAKSAVSAVSRAHEPAQPLDIAAIQGYCAQ